MRYAARQFILLVHLLIFSAMGGAPCFAQEIITIDLAEDEGEDYSLPVDADRALSIRVVNRVPNPDVNYTITVEVGEVEIEALPVDVFGGPRADTTAASPELSDDCAKWQSAYKKRYDALYGSMEEDRILSLKNGLYEAIDSVEAASDCSFPEEPNRDAAESLIGNTEVQFPAYRLSLGERLDVTIVRRESDSSELKTWRRSFATRPPGTWRVSYGFTFIGNVTSHVIPEPLYTTVEDEDGDNVITKQSEERRWMTFAPSVFFSFVPHGAATRKFTWGPTAGVGFDLSDPVAFLGIGIDYRMNLGVRLGIAFHEVEVLKGKYREGMVVDPQLSSDELHEDQPRLNPFITIAFRFDRAPFTSPAGSE